MKKNSESSSNGQGPVSDVIEDLKDLSVEVIEQWLTRDLKVVNSLVHALLTDKELRLHMATFLQGRYNNAKHKPDPNQMNLGV